MVIKFYTQGCPKCKVLEKKLEQKNISYELVNDFDIDELSARGVMSLPVLEIDGELLKFEDAVKWLREQ